MAIHPASEAIRDAWYSGIEEGVCRYAYWKDGVQYVGSCGRTLEQAIADIHKERDERRERDERESAIEAQEASGSREQPNPKPVGILPDESHGLSISGTAITGMPLTSISESADTQDFRDTTK